MGFTRQDGSMTTALITGATSGIGAAFASRLAQDGNDLVLVARSAEGLATTSELLANKYGISAEIIRADLAGEPGVGEVVARLADADRPIDLLVNNAGFGLSGEFLDSSADEHARMLRVNSEAVLRLSHAALGPMVNRGQGGILNVSSVASFTPGLRPSPTYAATKAFVTAFTEGLAAIASGSGVTITAVCPGLVRTGFHARASIGVSGVPRWLWTDVDDVVTASLEGLQSGKTIVIPGAQYKVIISVARHAPRSLLRAASALAGKRIR